MLTTFTHGSDCPINKSIHKSKEICNRLREKNLMNGISEYALDYIMSILITTFSCDYRGKTVDKARNSDRHRRSISRFLRYEECDDSTLKEKMRRLVIDIIYGESRKAVCRFYSLWTIPYHPKRFHHPKRPTPLRRHHFTSLT